MAAVVRVAAVKGYEATSVADILEEAGVGRESFYELFEDKQDCMLAARGILVDDLVATVGAAYRGPEPWPDRARKGLGAMLGWFAADPAAARVVVVELVALGPASRELFQEEFGRYTKLVTDGMDSSAQPLGMPQAASLAVGAAVARVYEEIVRDRTAQLTSLLPELTYELLIPFVGEEAARVEQRRADEEMSPPPEAA
jgi:AcrR family transcriptional regulator